MTIHLAFKSVDTGLCRVYYRRNRSLICFQWQSTGRFQRLVCSPDGEPIGPTMIGSDLPFDRLPPQDCSLSVEFHVWATQHNLRLLSASSEPAPPNTTSADFTDGLPHSE